MNKQTFLDSLTDIMQKETPCLEQDILEEYEDWDSLSKIATIAFFDRDLNKKIALEDIENAETVNDLIILAGDSISE